jgi:Zn finger protein HypA/HybF involved in hydrogenase expression
MAHTFKALLLGKRANEQGKRYQPRAIRIIEVVTTCAQCARQTRASAKRMRVLCPDCRTDTNA